MTTQPPSPLSFKREDAINALTEVLDSVKQADNAHAIDTARETAGNDMLKMMQTVFPLLTQIQMAVIERYGFTPDGEGMIRFTQLVKLYEKTDDDVAELNGELRKLIIPQMAAPAPQTAVET